MIDALTALRCRPTLHDLAAEGCRVRLAWKRTTWLGTAGPRDSRHRSGAGPPLDAGLPVEAATVTVRYTPFPCRILIA